MEKEKISIHESILPIFLFVGFAVLALITGLNCRTIDISRLESLSINLPKIGTNIVSTPPKAIKVFIDKDDKIYLSGDFIGKLTESGAGKDAMEALKRLEEIQSEVVQKDDMRLFTASLLIFSDDTIKAGWLYFPEFVNIWYAVNTPVGIGAIPIPVEIRNPMTPVNAESSRRFFLTGKEYTVPDSSGYLIVKVSPCLNYSVSPEKNKYIYSWGSRIFLYPENYQSRSLEEIGETVLSRAGDALVDLSVDYRATVGDLLPVAAKIHTLSLPWAVSYEMDPGSY